MKIHSEKLKSYQDINWKKCQEELLLHQQQLVEAYGEKQNRRVRQIQRQIVTSFEARALAVRRVTNNKGGQTPGVDGIKWLNPKSRLLAIEELQSLIQNPKAYRAQAVRRVEIPKPGKAEKRPLGIPTLIDRAMQAVYLCSIDPLVEETSDVNSYGFRPFRGPREAVAKLRNLLGKDYSPEWVLDADIQKCFDRINHNWLLENVPIGDRAVLESWLKSGVTCSMGTQETTMGVPQGGVISPALCNITLNGLEPKVKNATLNMVPKSQRTKVYLVRYADDFVATAVNKTILDKVEQSITEFLEPRGLQLHPQKTRSLELNHKVNTSFEFLGFEFSKHTLNPRKNRLSAKKQSQTRLVIRPSQASIATLKNKVNQAIKPQRPIASMIYDLNPKIRGWANYFRVARHSQRTFKTLGNWVWHKMLRWAQAKHVDRSVAWIGHRYLSKSQWRSNHWCDKKPGGNMYLLDIDTVGYQFIPTLASGLNPYVRQDREVLETRASKIAGTGTSGIRRALLNRDGAICPVCHTSVVDGNESVEIHHLKAQHLGGDWRLSNLVYLHSTCHKQITHNTELEKALRLQFCPEPAVLSDA